MDKLNDNRMEMQLSRIKGCPFDAVDVPGNLIVVDRLEEGVLEVLQHVDANHPVYLQPYENYSRLLGVDLIGRLKINVSEDKSIIIEELYYKEGYEQLRKALVNQVMWFSEFYNLHESIRFDGSIMEDWFRGLEELREE